MHCCEDRNKLFVTAALDTVASFSSLHAGTIEAILPQKSNRSSRPSSHVYALASEKDVPQSWLREEDGVDGRVHVHGSDRSCAPSLVDVELVWLRNRESRPPSRCAGSSRRVGAGAGCDSQGNRWVLQSDETAPYHHKGRCRPAPRYGTLPSGPKYACRSEAWVPGRALNWYLYAVRPCEEYASANQYEGHTNVSSA